MKRNTLKRIFFLLAIMMVLNLVNLFAGGSQARRDGTGEFPSRPITLIVHMAPGGGTDAVSRAVARFSANYLGVEMIIDNRPGGGQAVGNTFFSRQPPNGYTIAVWGPSGTTVLPLLQRVEYDPLVDQTAIGGVSNQRLGLFVGRDSPIQTFYDFVRFAQANPGQTVATTGVNGFGDLTVRLLNIRHNTNLIPVPYASAGEALLAVMGGETIAATNSTGASMAQIEAGTIRPLIVFANERDPMLPEVRTAREMGFDIALNNYIGFAVPAGTDPARIRVLENFLLRLPNNPEFVELMTNLGFTVDPMGAEEFHNFIASEIDIIREIIQATN